MSRAMTPDTVTGVALVVAPTLPDAAFSTSDFHSGPRRRNRDAVERPARPGGVRLR